MYRGVGDPFSSQFLSAQYNNLVWMDVVYPLLLLLAIALISSASTGVAAVDISPSQEPAHAPSIGAESVPIAAQAPQSNRSASNGSTNTNANGSPPYGFNRGFDKPYQRMTILIAALFIAVLIIGFCTHYVTLRSCQRGGNHEGEGGVVGQVRYEGGGGGLEPWVVRSLPTVRYGAARAKEVSDEEAAAPGTPTSAKQECTVCLSEFEEGEEMKALPECGHAFHSSCIDMWLLSHTTCPICRLSLLKHFKKANSKLDPAPSPRGPHVPSPRGPHLAIDLLPISASTSSDPRHIAPGSTGWQDHVDDDVQEHARNSSAALYPHFPSSS